MQDLTTFLANHAYLSAAAALILVLVTIIEFLRIKRLSFAVNPSRITQLINRENALVIDVRPKDIYRQGHIIDALSMTAEDLKQSPKKLEKYRARPLIIVAGNNTESQKLAALLIKNGYNAYSLSGGIPAWNEAQMPLVKE